jgi:nicotinate phosphoribosyltransferase
MNSFLRFENEQNMSLFTDFYELTMCASYFDNQKFELATFDLFMRRLPPNRSYFLVAGIEQALLFLKNIRFSVEHITYLRKQGFQESFLQYLKTLKFTGEVWAAPEGSIVLPNEPILRITAPIIEAQLVETFLLNTINLQTMIATKASRVVEAAHGKPVIEFGLRREHGIDAGMKVARSSYIAGCSGTSNVLAAMVYSIPVFGTMAHSFVMSYEKEIDAFRAFAKTFPAKSTLLIDTYDDLAGAEKAVVVAKEMEQLGSKLGGVRLDSGNLAENSKKVRSLLDENGLEYVKIFVSGDLDEYKIEELENQKTKIDSYGVGTKMGTSQDYPYTDVIYKLCEVENGKGKFSPIMKLSKEKNTMPGRKQVYRFIDDQGCFSHDIIALANEEIGGKPLLQKVMQRGKLIYVLPSLNEIRTTAESNLSKLPTKYKKLANPPVYSVQVSDKLNKMITDLKERLIKTEISSTL